MIYPFFYDRTILIKFVFSLFLAKVIVKFESFSNLMTSNVLFLMHILNVFLVKNMINNIFFDLQSIDNQYNKENIFQVYLFHRLNKLALL